MSYGNVNTQGSTGSNAPWQSAVLTLLKQVVASSGGGSPSVLTPAVIRPTGIGTITNAKSASVLNSGGANGLVLGTTLKPGEILTWEVGQDTNTLGNISYDATGTEFLINTLS